jgi:hypothetical protein
MNTDKQTVLSPDFAQRVVERVRIVRRRRRRIRGWALAAAAGCAVLVAVIALRPARDSGRQLVTQIPTARPEWTSPAVQLAGQARPPAVAVSDPLQLFFPAAGEVADFQAWEATSWHSYDPWWNPGQAAD